MTRTVWAQSVNSQILAPRGDRRRVGKRRREIDAGADHPGPAAAATYIQRSRVAGSVGARDGHAGRLVGETGGDRRHDRRRRPVVPVTETTLSAPGSATYMVPSGANVMPSLARPPS